MISFMPPIAERFGRRLAVNVSDSIRCQSVSGEAISQATFPRPASTRGFCSRTTAPPPQRQHGVIPRTPVRQRPVTPDPETRARHPRQRSA